MHVETIVAPVFGTNSYLVSATGSGPCLIIDAGGGVVPALTERVGRAGLEPVALLATHGHVDHTWSAAELCDLYDVPLLIHADDAFRLADPFGTIEDRGPGSASGPLAQALAAGGCDPAAYLAPARVQPFVRWFSLLALVGFIVGALAGNWAVFLSVIGAVLLVVAVHDAVSLAIGYGTAVLAFVERRMGWIVGGILVAAVLLYWVLHL